jgi:hypothetical protein
MIMAMVGFADVWMRRLAAAESSSNPTAACDEANSSSNCEISRPETKALSPAPRRTMTRTVGSASNRSKISGTARHISMDTALRRVGLLKVTHPTAPSISAIMLSVLSGTKTIVHTCFAIGLPPAISNRGVTSSRILKR